MKLMLKKSGFTLVELLVAITIISILAAIGLVTYSLALKQGRDSKRQTDIRAIQSALEQYNSDQFYYPANPGMDNLLATPQGQSFTSSIGAPSPFPSPVKTYLNVIPEDPTRSVSRYAYTPLGTGFVACNNTTIKCINYCMYAKLENAPSPVPAAPPGCTYPLGYNFAVSPP